MQVAPGGFHVGDVVQVGELKKKYIVVDEESVLTSFSDLGGLNLGELDDQGERIKGKLLTFGLHEGVVPERVKLVSCPHGGSDSPDSTTPLESDATER